VSIAVGISFGLKLPDAGWMAIAAIIAMKPSRRRRRADRRGRA
jgi:hypothetical protein